MTDLTQRLSKLSAAEEFLDFFGIAYDQSVVDVNRLHILKRFQQYLRNAAGGLADLGEVEVFRRYRDLLARAYQDFVDSTPAREKVFKVLREADGARVPLQSLRAQLAERAAARI